jgi:hypothetical protein
MDAADPAARLRAIVDQLDDGDARLLLSSLDRRIASRLRRAQRDRLVAEIAAHHFAAAPSERERARQIAEALGRYMAAGWRHDRQRSRCPYAGNTLRAALWRVLAVADGRALTAERVRKVLGRAPPLFMTHDPDHH